MEGLLRRCGTGQVEGSSLSCRKVIAEPMGAVGELYAMARGVAL